MIQQFCCPFISIAPFLHPEFAPCKNSCYKTHPLQAGRERGSTMPNMTEPIVLLRARTELPRGLNLKTSEFDAGWDFIRYGRASGLEKKIQKRQWQFIRVADET